MTSNGLASNGPRPRLCHLRRWPDFVGYGFNLHSEKSKPGQYIGKVDPNSPADSAGLHENDRIVEVNFVPIGNENHKQVVQRIKEGVTRNGTKYPEEVILLVLDPDADEYYKSKSIVVKSSDPNVEKLEAKSQDEIKSGDSSPNLSDRNSGKGDDSPITRQASPPKQSNEYNREYKHVTDFTRPQVTQNKNADLPVTSRAFDQNYVNPDDHEPYVQTTPSNSDKNKRSNLSQSSSGNGSGGVFELPMSAAEYREKLKSQNGRKRDLRKNNQMSMKEKHDVIDRL
ncbi:unnamed protein product [Rotaria sp. Silwood2]|nr:unnamed protein product [Rotaria sp. Silwood2]CAF3181895.1 unnamed protein product [Rotaria sp. Silwood2]CAF4277326.1 unnamed protein product [Rotaria sp. Silwood2]CAF4418015.1 unnamed protein product [Rotaria sp. Silwood2]